MTASAAEVEAAQKAAGCWFEETVAGLFCNKHHCYADQRHADRDQCNYVAGIADAVVAAAQPRIAAETRRGRYCGCAWCCSGNARGVEPGDAHRNCSAQKDRARADGPEPRS